MEQRRVIVEHITVLGQALGRRPDDVQMLPLVGVEAVTEDIEGPQQERERDDHHRGDALRP